MTETAARTAKILNIATVILIGLYFLTASVFVIQIRGHFPYQYIGAFSGVPIVVLFIVNRKAQWADWLLTLVFLSILFAALAAGISGMPEAYRKLSVSSAIMAVPLYLMTAYLRKSIKEKVSVMDFLFFVLKGVSLLQVLWILIQYVFYHALSIDINEVIFADLLHQEGLVSFYREGFYPAGFTWHGGSIAPLLVLAFVMIKNPFIRLVILAESFLVGSSTAIIGVFTALFMTILLGLIKKEYNLSAVKALFTKKNIWKPILAAVLLIGAVLVAWRLKLFDIVADRALYLLARIKDPTLDRSTRIHIRYFTGYPRVFKESTMVQRIFGYGNYSSGYPFQIIFGQYKKMETFVVECDFINLLVSRGIFGFLVYYFFLLKTGIKGLKLDSRYLVFIAAVFVQGAGYNVQWQYIFMTEVLMYLSVENGLNFFDAPARLQEGKGKLWSNAFSRSIIKL